MNIDNNIFVEQYLPSMPQGILLQPTNLQCETPTNLDTNEYTVLELSTSRYQSVVSSDNTSLANGSLNPICGRSVACGHAPNQCEHHPIRAHGTRGRSRQHRGSVGLRGREMSRKVVHHCPSLSFIGRK